MGMHLLRGGRRGRAGWRAKDGTGGGGSWQVTGERKSAQHEPHAGGSTRGTADSSVERRGKGRGGEGCLHIVLGARVPGVGGGGPVGCLVGEGKRAQRHA